MAPHSSAATSCSQPAASRSRSRAANLAFSSEFLPDDTPLLLRRRLKSANGSYACSPSASAVAWGLTRDADTYRYLTEVLDAAGGGGRHAAGRDIALRASGSVTRGGDAGPLR